MSGRMGAHVFMDMGITRVRFACRTKHKCNTYFQIITLKNFLIYNSIDSSYTICLCSRGGASINGQLMRIHIVTPKAPVNVTLNPQVQPGPDPCPRYLPQPAAMPPIKLSPSAYWVLRLPSVYVGDQGPHYPPDPRHPAPPAFARLLKGCYGISQLAVDRL